MRNNSVTCRVNRLILVNSEMQVRWTDCQWYDLISVGNGYWSTHTKPSHTRVSSPHFYSTHPIYEIKKDYSKGGLMVFSTLCLTGYWVFSTYFGTTISTPISYQTKNGVSWLWCEMVWCELTRHLGNSVKSLKQYEIDCFWQQDQQMPWWSAVVTRRHIYCRSSREDWTSVNVAESTLVRSLI